MSVKDDLLNEAARQFEALREALGGLSDEQLAAVWLGSWSVKDIAAHMSGWHREMGPALERLARGERPLLPGVSYEDVDAWNAKFTAARQGTSSADVLRELDESHQYFMHAAAAVPAERYQPDKSAYKIVDLNSAHHYKHHGDQIRTWRASFSA